MAVAFVALFAALAGGAIALPGTGTVDSGDIKNNSVKSKDIKNRTIKSRDVKKNSLGGAVIREDRLGQVPDAAHADAADTATSANTATNAANAALLGGASPSAFAPANVVRSVSVNANGTIIPAESFGVTQANVTRIGVGQYCVNGLSPAPRTVAISGRFGAQFGSQYFAEVTPSNVQVCGAPARQIGIALYSAGNALQDNNFMLLIK